MGFYWNRRRIGLKILKESVVGAYKHYANMSVQYTAIFHGCKNDNFQTKKCDIFLIFAQNIDSGYTLEPVRRFLRVPIIYVLEQK